MSQKYRDFNVETGKQNSKLLRHEIILQSQEEKETKLRNKWNCRGRGGVSNKERDLVHEDVKNNF